MSFFSVLPEYVGILYMGRKPVSFCQCHQIKINFQHHF